MSPAMVRGKALIFWDPECPGKKQNGIDTDQIMPSDLAYCESLEHLDARWKEAAFGHRMKNFRERIHGGETFLIAGERFGIGSSRESAVAGLKAIAEEKGLELVIVCGKNMGEIYRQNAISQGLHFCQSPEAVEDAQDGDEFEFDLETYVLRNLTRGKHYNPSPLTPVERRLLRAGGIIGIGQAQFASRQLKPPVIEFPDSDLARTMTVTEQIVWAHRADKRCKVFPGETLEVYADLLPASDGSAPLAIHAFRRIAGDEVRPRKCALMNDHFAFSQRDEHKRQVDISRQFAELIELAPPYYAEKGTGIFHFYLPEQGLILPGGFYPGADSHSRSYGAYGAIGIGVGATTLGFGWAVGYVFFKCPTQRKVIFTGKLQPWVTGKDVVLSLIQKWGRTGADGMSVELIDSNLQLPMAYRHTIANMMAEAEVVSGIFPQDEITTRWFQKKGIRLPYPRINPGSQARYDREEEFNLSNVIPMIAKPYHPSNSVPADELCLEKIKINKAYIGSCTNGGYEDLFQAAWVMRAARDHGIAAIARDVEFAVYPGSGEIRKKIEIPDPRLGGESIGQLFRSFGGKVRESWCGPCFGQGEDALKSGDVAITSFNRNFHNRMGKGGLAYLANPMAVASSALAGYVTTPDELGIPWEPSAMEF